MIAVNYKHVRSIIEHAVKQYLEDTRYEVTNKISVTEALYCLRSAYYNRILDEEYIDRLVTDTPYTSTDFYFFVGKTVHSKLQEYVKTAAINILGKTGIGYRNCLAEVEVQDDVLIGHIDIVLRTKNVDIPLEIKTCRRLPRKPFKEHLYQLSTYMVLGKNEFSFEKGYIIYISRTQGDIRIFRVEPMKYRYDYVKERAVKLLYHIGTKTPPEPEKVFYCWKCPFKPLCPTISSRKRSKK